MCVCDACDDLHYTSLVIYPAKCLKYLMCNLYTAVREKVGDTICM